MFHCFKWHLTLEIALEFLLFVYGEYAFGVVGGEEVPPQRSPFAPLLLLLKLGN